MASRRDFLATRYAKIVNALRPAYGETGTTTTFTLYRRQVTGAANDLGIKPTAWQAVVSGRNCVIAGVETEVRQHFAIPQQGIQRSRMVSIHTTYTGVLEGDTILLASDNTYYLVQSVTVEGAVSQILLNSGQAPYRGT